MKNSKHTKRALLTSVLAMLVCVSMLIGSTFAWFTDTAATGTNRIVSGKLDVVLEYTHTPNDENSWAAVDENTNLFMPTDGANATRWEPGHTEYVYLRLRNAGSLALKYQFAVNVYGDAAGGAEKTYTSREGNPFRLSDYLVFTQIDGAAPIENREDLWISDSAAEEAAMGRLDSLGAAGVLLPEGKGTPEQPTEKLMTLAVYMPTQVDNRTNQLSSAKEIEGEPTIFLGLTVVATQASYENDSFGSDYDADVVIPDVSVSTFSELQEAVNNAQPGDVIALTNDVAAEQLLYIDKDLTIDGGGHKMTGTGFHRGFRIASGANVVIRNAEISNVDSEDLHSCVFMNYGTLTVENCILKDNQTTYSCAILETMSGSVQTFRNCLIINNVAGDLSSGEGSVLQNYRTSVTTFEGCIIAGNNCRSGGSSGGAICFREYGGDVTLTGCILADNQTSDFSAFSESYGISDSNVLIKNCVFGTVYNNQADILENAAQNGSVKIEGLSILREDGTLQTVGTSAVPTVYSFVWSADHSTCALKIMTASTTGVIMEDHACTVTSTGDTVTAEVTVDGITYTDTKQVTIQP